MNYLMSDIRSKILDLDTLKEKSTTIQNSGKKIVFTNGCFDILHSGHIHTLSEAKKNITKNNTLLYFTLNIF